MQQDPLVLARYDEFGSVSCCAHGCVHVQLGHTVMVLSEQQYLKFVAMVNDSAANFEYHRSAAHGTDDEAPEADRGF